MQLMRQNARTRRAGLSDLRTCSALRAKRLGDVDFQSDGFAGGGVAGADRCHRGGGSPGGSKRVQEKSLLSTIAGDGALVAGSETSTWRAHPGRLVHAGKSSGSPRFDVRAVDDFPEGPQRTRAALCGRKPHRIVLALLATVVQRGWWKKFSGYYACARKRQASLRGKQENDICCSAWSCS